MHIQHMLLLAGALTMNSAHAAPDLDQIFGGFGPTGYALLTVALFGILWRYLRPQKRHRRSADKWPWE